MRKLKFIIDLGDLGNDIDPYEFQQFLKQSNYLTTCKYCHIDNKDENDLRSKDLSLAIEITLYVMPVVEGSIDLIQELDVNTFIDLLLKLKGIKEGLDFVKNCIVEVKDKNNGKIRYVDKKK